MRFLVILLALIVGCEQPSVTVPLRIQVIAFTATWCGPCKEQALIVDEIEATGINLHRIDVDQQPGLARRYGVTAVPTYLLFNGRTLVLRTNQAQEILDKL